MVNYSVPSLLWITIMATFVGFTTSSVKSFAISESILICLLTSPDLTAWTVCGKTPKVADAFYCEDVTKHTLVCFDLSLCIESSPFWQFLFSTEIISLSCSYTALLPVATCCEPWGEADYRMNGMVWKAQTPLWVMLQECDEPAKWLLLQGTNSIYM